MDIDFTKFCSGEDDATSAICSINDKVEGILTGVDTFFLLFAGALVFLMQAGFAMLCAGSVRQKNVKNIMLKNLLDACGGAIGFYTLGYGFAYGSGSTFIGLNNFAITELRGSGYIEFFFQFAFAATAATIVAGTVAERCKMAAYLCYSLFLTAFVSVIEKFFVGIVGGNQDSPNFATALIVRPTINHRFTQLSFVPSGVMMVS